MEKNITFNVLILISTIPDVFNFVINLNLNKKFFEESKLRWRSSSFGKNSSISKPSKNSNCIFEISTNMIHRRRSSSARKIKKSLTNVIVVKDSCVFLDPRVSIDKTHHKLVKYSLRSSISPNRKKIQTSRTYLSARRRTSVGLSKRYDKESKNRQFSL